MTVAQTTRIDIMTRDPSGGIMMVIVEHEDWEDRPQMLEELSKKLHTYASYARSGEFRSEYGSSPVMIRLITLHEPTHEARALLNKFSTSTGIPTEIEKTTLPE